MSKISKLNLELCERYGVESVDELSEASILEALDYIVDKVKNQESEVKIMDEVSELSDRLRDDEKIKGFVILVDDDERVTMIGKGNDNWFEKAIRELHKAVKEMQ